MRPPDQVWARIVRSASGLPFLRPCKSPSFVLVVLVVAAAVVAAVALIVLRVGLYVALGIIIAMQRRRALRMSRCRPCSMDAGLGGRRRRCRSWGRGISGGGRAGVRRQALDGAGEDGPRRDGPAEAGVASRWAGPLSEEVRPRDAVTRGSVAHSLGEVSP